MLKLLKSTIKGESLFNRATSCDSVLYSDLAIRGIPREEISLALKEYRQRYSDGRLKPQKSPHAQFYLCMDFVASDGIEFVIETYEDETFVHLKQELEQPVAPGDRL